MKSAMPVRWYAPATSCPLRGSVLTLVSGLELRDIDLRHLQHRLHRALRAVPVWALEELVQPLRDDLPRQAEAVLQPTAHAVFAATLDEGAPVAVDFGLVLAVDDERDRFAERELRPAVEAYEWHATQGEVDGQDVAFRVARVVSRGARDIVDAAVREEIRVELGGLLGLAVEPQAGRDLRHGVTSIVPPVIAWRPSPSRTPTSDQNHRPACDPHSTAGTVRTLEERRERRDGPIDGSFAPALRDARGCRHEQVPVEQLLRDVISHLRVRDPQLELPVAAQAQRIEVRGAGEDGVVGQDDLGMRHAGVLADVDAGLLKGREECTDRRLGGER